MIFPFIGLELYGQVAKENYQDSIFLDLRGDLRDPEVLGRDWEVYIRAYRRVRQHMRFQIEGQAIRFVWDVKSGSELKVSEQIFNHIVRLWEKYNRRLATGRYDILLELGIFIVQPKKNPQLYPVGGKYQDSTFLFINGNLNIPTVAAANAYTFVKAQERVERYLYIRNNRYEWKDISAPELRISDNIFDYIVDMRERENDRLATGKYVIRRLRLNGRYYTLRKDYYCSNEEWYPLEGE